jgi:Spy/CpxP family protein refolding chaperone
MKCRLIAVNPMATKFCFVAALSLALVAGIGMMPFSADAQDQESPAVTKKLPSPDEVVDVLGSKLNLSDDQKAQITPIIEERRQKLQALRSDTSVRPFPKKRKMKSIFDESDKKIKAVLNDEQRKQYAQIEKQMREEMKERMQNRGSAN